MNSIITSAISIIEEHDSQDSFLAVQTLEQEKKINENKLTDQINMQFIDEETTGNNFTDELSSLVDKQEVSNQENEDEHLAVVKLLEKEAKPAENKDAKTKKTNKKSADPPVDCFPCSIL